ncbi:ABC transporter permease [Roseivirga sp.]|uniref:ABC transporter permease n=1 Tax=Roseivirga sp. TaxID=1964215 RepID=UPI003B5169DF
MKLSILWQSRGILFHLIKRDILVTYKQTLLGVFWAILKPLIMALVIAFVFGRLGNFPSYGLPYILIALPALSFWEFFSSSVNRGSICLIDDRGLITRISFPRIILPLNASLRNTLGLVINLIVIIAFMFHYKIPMTLNLLMIPLVYFSTILLNFGVNLWLSTINVFYRDVMTLVPFLLRAGLFISPVAFTLESVPVEWRQIYCLNPLVGIIESMRFCVLGSSFLPDSQCLIISGISLICLLLSGLFLFGKYERKFADVI